MKVLLIALTSIIVSFSNSGAQDFWKKGRIALEQGKYNKAHQIYLRANKKYPNNAEIIYYISICNYNLDDLESCIKNANESLSIDSSNADCTYLRGRSKYLLKDSQGALVDYSKALALFDMKYDQDKTQELYYDLGIVKYDLGDYKGALKDLDRAIELKNDIPYYYIDRGLAKEDLNDNQGALSDYDQCIKLDSTNAECYFHRAGVKELMIDYLSALEDYNSAIQLDSTDSDYFYFRGELKIDLGFIDAGKKDLLKCLELNPNDDSAKNSLWELDEY